MYDFYGRDIHNICYIFYKHRKLYYIYGWDGIRNMILKKHAYNQQIL